MCMFSSRDFCEEFRNSWIDDMGNRVLVCSQLETEMEWVGARWKKQVAGIGATPRGQPVSTGVKYVNVLWNRKVKEELHSMLGIGHQKLSCCVTASVRSFFLWSFRNDASVKTCHVQLASALIPMLCCFFKELCRGGCLSKCTIWILNTEGFFPREFDGKSQESILR